MKNELAAYLFHQGTNFYSYKYLGAHKIKNDEYVFRVYAPKAYSVYLTADFCGWEEGIPMERITKQGIWECFAYGDNIKFSNYKFRVISKAGIHYKSDPYAFYSQTREKTASIVWENEDFNWNDENWQKSKQEIFLTKNTFYSAPLNIYEMHLHSWMTRNGSGTKGGNAYLNYREIADELVVYIKQLGCTHVELMPIAEHPYDGSWGYQICGYYAPTSRFGTPDDFKYLVNTLHRNSIGVILDWVPAHFPKDEHGLYEFDGGELYEFQGKDRIEHSIWGTRRFDIARCEVQSFLISNALFWLREYHIDGLRVDAVASMLYLDYDKKPGEWNPNIYGGNQSLEAIAFFKKLNTAVFKEFPCTLMIAEESADWPMITKPVNQGGLGFNFKWNMGYSNDMFDYMQTDPIFRRHKHRSLTFPMMYAFSENYILTISHDEVTHGKKSLIDKMFGSYEQKFANLRAFMIFFMTHPGKKMTFMGCEYGQFREWDYENQLEWFMTDYPMHKKLQIFNAELNQLYLDSRPLWEDDFSWNGFEWIYPDMKDENIIVYLRKSRDGDEFIIAINFSPIDRYDFAIKVRGKAYTEIFSSDNARYGGTNKLNKSVICTQNEHIKITLPGFSGIILKLKTKV